MRPIKRKHRNSSGKITDELDNLQLSSWNLELLFSAVFLFVLSELKGSLPELIQFSNNVVSPMGEGGTEDRILSVIIYLAAHVFRIALNLLSISLILHIVLRGFWISLIGLRYVSGGIDIDALNYSKFFEKRARASTDYDTFIERVEKICSVVYATIFLLLFFLLSFLTFVISISIISWFIELIYDGEELVFIIPVLFFLFFPFTLYLVDTATMGWLQRIKRPAIVGRIYSPLHKVMQYLTLSILYRPVFHNFMDNKYSRRIAFSIIPLIMLYSIWFVIDYQPSAFWPDSSSMIELSKNGKAFNKDYFDKERDEFSRSPIIHFPSRYVESNIVELNLRYFPSMDRTIEEKLPEIYEAGNETGFKLFYPKLKKNVSYLEFMEAYTALFTISVNDSAYLNPEFALNLSEDIKALDFTAALNVSHLPNGYVHVEVSYPEYDFISDALVTKTEKIPLIKR